MFDVAIVTQSYLYRSRTPPHHRGRKGSVHVRTHSGEEQGLLSAGTTGAEEPIVPQRRRAVGTTDGDFVEVEG
jgi:solute carrier family 66 (lysosomal lysine-arginine transporter), member 1